jgi:hypothetical protein
LNNNIINSNFNIQNNNSNDDFSIFNNLITNTNITNENYNNLNNNYINGNNNNCSNLNNNFINGNNNNNNNFNNYNNEQTENELNDNNCQEDDIDSDLLQFLIELAPFNTKEEIIEKIYEYNYDIDKVISNLLIEVKEEDSPKEDSKLKFLINSNKFNSNDEGNKNTKRKIKTKANKILKYNIDERKISEFLRKNGDNKKIDLHGFRLSEAMLKKRLK